MSEPPFVTAYRGTSTRHCGHDTHAHPSAFTREPSGDPPHHVAAPPVEGARSAEIEKEEAAAALFGFFSGHHDDDQATADDGADGEGDGNEFIASAMAPLNASLGVARHDARCARPAPPHHRAGARCHAACITVSAPLAGMPRNPQPRHPQPN